MALLESRPFRPYRSSEEYLVAVKEDLAEWLQLLYPHLGIAADNFMERLETGVALCEHANAVNAHARDYVRRKAARRQQMALAAWRDGVPEVKCRRSAKPGTFFARDNVSNFIGWCRDALRVLQCLLFESDDLIMRKNEKHVILCLLEVARGGARVGVAAPMLVRMERQIDREIAAEMDGTGAEEVEEEEEEEEDEEDEDDGQPVLVYGPTPQIVTNDLKSLDEMVRDLVARCTCPTQFPMVRVAEGKYRIGDTKVLIFVRILRSHVMVRVGGGWDTLSHYLDKHDPCRCRAQHRPTQGARLIPPSHHHPQQQQQRDLHGAHVVYERSAPTTTPKAPVGKLGPPTHALGRSRSRSPATPPPRPRRASPDSTDHSDNASEVSDEGYRSLGAIYAPGGTWSGRQRARAGVRRAHSASATTSPRRGGHGDHGDGDGDEAALLAEVDRLLQQLHLRVVRKRSGGTRIPAPIAR